MKAIDIMLNGTRIDTVFRHRDANLENVRKDLIENMMYDPDIVLEEVR